MTFEGFDAAPLIEAAGFTPAVLASAEPAAPDAATLDAALREAARAERASVRAEATLLDLWLDRPGGANLYALDPSALGASSSWQSLAAMTGDEDVAVAAANDGKPSTMRAAYGDKDDELEGGVVKGTRPKTVDDDSDWAVFWSGSGGTGEGGGDMGGGGSDVGGSSA